MSIKPFALRLSFLACALCVCALQGCGSGYIKVKGKVLKGGEPLRANGRTLQVTFYPVDVGKDGAQDAYLAHRSIDGTFSVPGKTGKGIPAGKYKIAVELMSS